MIKKLLFVLTLAVAAGSIAVAPADAQAKRLGAGKPAGMQRQAPPAQPANATPQPASPAPQQAAPATAPGAAAAAATPPKRSWMGPLAGLAAGLGLAALASHFGFGEGLANFMMMALVAIVAFVAIRWLMSRLSGGPRLAGAGAGPGGAAPQVNEPVFTPRTALEPASSPAAVAAPAALAAATPAAQSLPPGFDAAEFERIAKMIFIRLQAANDSGNVDDLRRFTTPELFASLKADLLERGSAKQTTDVMQLDAQVADAATADGQSIVTVRFSGLIREQEDAGAERFAELWHLVRPLDGSHEWAIAGITPQAV